MGWEEAESWDNNKNKKPVKGSLKENVIVKENKTLKNTNISLTESSIKQKLERILYCEKITTPQTIVNVIEPDNLKEQNIPDLITSGPKEICDTKKINQSLTHKNKKTFKKQSNAFSSSNTENSGVRGPLHGSTNGHCDENEKHCRV